MKTLDQLNVQIFADGADIEGMIALYRNPLVQGLTTNPTLMRKAGIKDYEGFCREVLDIVKEKPISFEVFSDDFDEMRRQALKIQSWQDNVFVKIPITNTRGESTIPLIRQLSADGVQLNVTAILTLDQVRAVAGALKPTIAAVISVFAGRIADTGRSPVPLMKESLSILKEYPKASLLWASVREVLNIFEADDVGCQIVTVPHDILGKAIKMCAMDLASLSLDTVKMFRNDAISADFTINT
jgi:transaldolase